MIALFPQSGDNRRLRIPPLRRAQAAAAVRAAAQRPVRMKIRMRIHWDDFSLLMKSGKQRTLFAGLLIFIPVFPNP